MLLHQYDSQTGQYLNSFLADPDPLNPGRWLEPAFTTSTPLPERPRLTWPVFRDGLWSLVPDYRTLRLYRKDNGEVAEILVIGITPDDAGLTDVPRPSDEHFGARRQNHGRWIRRLSQLALATRRWRNSRDDAQLPCGRTSVRPTHLPPA